MHGRKCLLLGFILILSSCAKQTFLKADCNSCTSEEQEWKDFTWNDLRGNWRGSAEFLQNDPQKLKKSKQEKRVEIKFYEAATFLKSHGMESCSGLPTDAIVMNGVLWEKSENMGSKEYEVFAKAEEGKVVYGRMVSEKLNNKNICYFQRYGRVMGKNRLSLPYAEFSERSSILGRSIASEAEEKRDVNIHLEFLRFDVASAKKPANFKPDGRLPASAIESERPALFFRVFKLSSTSASGKEEWTGTEEMLYRLWKAE